MGYLTQSLAGKEMERKPSSSSTKIERKIIEKNRRNYMKNLYNNLNSLLPNRSCKEALPLPDQIDEAINYIKSLEGKLQECNVKKENLMGRKRSYACTNSPATLAASSKPPKIEIHEMGSTLEVVLTTSVDNQFIFYEVIRILQEDGAEVVNANCSTVGNTIFQVIHAEMGDRMFSFGAAKITERLNQFVLGSTSEVELQSPELWNFAIDPECWDF
ncbi:transcription factor bHLH162-like [Pistacia vera]|uniref:transcription factor bHLH162-like n=1 Tax=Pistacia vera TaxID=55513 RepID=UPI001263BC12|nr:transcription factor bHLH162-like [Pistacia vera]